MGLGDAAAKHNEQRYGFDSVPSFSFCGVSPIRVALVIFSGYYR
jgi:hypothetical protein